MNKQKIIIGVLAAALGISLTANAVTWMLWPKDGSSGTDRTGSVVVSPQEEKPDTDTQSTQNVKAMLRIETPYGTLQYPERYAEHLHCESSNDNGVFSQTFYYLRNDEKIEMFRVRFGDADTGTFIGYVKQNEETVAFNVTSTTFEPNETWTDEETERYTAMLMAINDVIASVQAWDGYLG